MNEEYLNSGYYPRYSNGMSYTSRKEREKRAKKEFTNSRKKESERYRSRR